MQTARIAIVGAGLSGLYAAFLLEQQGIRDYVLLEARESVGGRITSAPASPHPLCAGTTGVNEIDRVDLGPTWFWPESQPQLARVINDLGLETFAQHETGDTVVERSPNEPPMRMRGYASSPTSMRLVGGMGALTQALHRSLDAARICTGQVVCRLRSTPQGVELDSDGAHGDAATWCVEHVLLALPPRLVESNIEFAPALPITLSRQWRATATWMAPHAKYTMLRCRGLAQRFSASSAFLRRFARAFQRKYCVRIAVRNSRACSAPRRRCRKPNSSRIGRWTRTPRPQRIRMESANMRKLRPSLPHRAHGAAASRASPASGHSSSPDISPGQSKRQARELRASPPFLCDELNQLKPNSHRP
jgi:monoamine oxidase